MNQEKMIKIALADDHALLRNALDVLINGFENCKVVISVNNGIELMEQLKKGVIPDLILLDLNMPLMDGFETITELKKAHPGILILMLTMYDSELSLIKLLRLGINGFLKKDIHPEELKLAIKTAVDTGYYYSNAISAKLAGLFRQDTNNSLPLHQVILSDQDLQFLELSASDLTYKEIAQQMSLTPRSIDAIRDQLFLKLDVKSRVGLAIIAIKNGLAK